MIPKIEAKPDSNRFKAELTSCGDTGVYGMTIWFNTRERRKAKVIMKRLIRKFNKLDQ